MNKGLSFSESQRIDLLCTEFEADWSLTEKGRLREMLQKCPEHLQEAAFVELLLVDIELKTASSVRLDSEDYTRQFPEFTGVIETVWASASLESSIESTRDSTGNTWNEPAMPTFAADQPEEGLQFGRFTLCKKLGQGVFGTVYLAYDPALDREVALKLPRFPPGDASRTGRFLEEAKIAARLHHPNIVAAWERGRVGEQLYISSEYVQGETLEHEIKEAAVELRTAVTWTRDLAEALQYAHEERVIHRDIKPANIMVGEHGRPMLMDFGLAKRTDSTATATMDGSVLGSIAYMSPEQSRGVFAEIGPASDQYSLGAVFYELLTGSPRFSGEGLSILNALRDGPPPPAFNVTPPALPADVVTICRKMLAPDVEGRYGDCGDAARDLTNWLEGRPITARRATPLERLTKWCRRNPLVASLLSTIAAVLVISLIAISAAFIDAAYARDRAQLHLGVAQENERVAATQRDKARAAAIAQRQEVSRSNVLLAAEEIRSGRFQEALSLLNGVDKADRGWVWKVQRARIPREISRFQLPGNALPFSLRAFFDESGKRLAICFHLRHGPGVRDFRMVTWLINTRTGECVDRVMPDYQVVAPMNGAFTDGGRYLVAFVEKEKSRRGFSKIIAYDSQAKKVVAQLDGVDNYAPSPYRPHEVLIQKSRDADGKYEHLVWNFLTGKTTSLDHGKRFFSPNFSTDINSQEIATRNNNWVTVAGATGSDGESRAKLMQRLGAVHWNISADRKYIVGQLQNVWPWNRRGITVSAGQAAVVEFPLRMKSVLETDKAVAQDLFDYQRGHSQLVSVADSPLGFSISDDSSYVTLNMNAYGFESRMRSLCWWSLESGEYLGKAAGFAVTGDGALYASEHDGAIVIRQAPLHVRRFRSRAIENELARCQPVSPTPHKRFYPMVAYVQDQPWLILSRQHIADKIDRDAHIVQLDRGDNRTAAFVAVDHQNQRLACIGDGNCLKVISLQKEPTITRLEFTNRLAASFFCFHPNGRQLVTGDVKGLAFWSLETGNILKRLDQYPCPRFSHGQLKFSSEGNYLCINSGVPRSLVLDTATWQPVRKGPLNRFCEFSLSHDEKLLSVSTGYGQVSVESLATGKIVQQFATDAKALKVVFHPNQPILIMGRDDGRLVMYDTRTWNTVLDEQLPEGRVVQMKFNQAGTSLAVCIRNGTHRWFEFTADNPSSAR